MKTPSLFLALALPALAADSVVTFNEIHYNPDGGTEWIELHNQMAINVDLSGWELTGGVDFVIPDGTTIPAGGYFIIAQNPSDPSLAGLGAVGPFEGALSNGGETIRLRSSSARLMDEVDYDDSGQWPLGPDGSGATLAKSNSSLLSDKSSSWTTSTQLGGTPGALNFPLSSAPISHLFVANDAAWQFEDSGNTPPANWNTTTFNDSSWSSGQTPIGTGGSGASAVLTMTDHLVERFRAGDLSLSNGQAVSTWTDTATGDGLAQSATASGNPTFASNATPSGEPAVRFDGNDQLRTSLSPGIGATDGFVYFAVIKANSTPGAGGVTNGNGPYLWDRDDSFDNPLVSLKSDGGNYGFQKRYDEKTGLGGPVSSTAISTSDYQIVALRRNTTSGLFEMWVDGVQESTEADSGIALTPQPIVIGNHSNNTIGFDGDIAELLIYEEELATSEFEAVGTYLEARYGLDTAFPDSTNNSSLAANGATAYLRQSFTYTGIPTDTTIRLDHLVADGAVFYLNGIEIDRFNMPTGTITHSTKALSNIPNPTSSGFITLPTSALQNGNNTLAVSLHPASGNTSVTFSASLEGTETPSGSNSNSTLVLNEVSPAGDANFFIEITNPSNSPLSTSGYTLEIEGVSINLPTTTLNSGDLLLLDQTILAQIPADGDKLFLFPPGGTLSDAREVTNRLRGLSSDYAGQWLFPSAATPGQANTFSFSTDIVINEICYNPPILDSDPGILPTINTVTLINPGAVWRYNEAGDSLPSNWAAQSHSIGGNWQSGTATLAYDTGLGITNLTNPASNSPRVVTYYFERDFTLTTQEAADLETLSLNHRIDDGAIIYLNGVEIDSYKMPTGAVNSSTTALPPAVTDADWIGEFNVTIPSGTAIAGTNRISVEVHQNSLTSSDVTFDLEANLEVVLDPGTPATIARSSEAQWIELHNRGNQTISLSDWDFGEGIDYTFPLGTSLAAGAYLVVSNDPATLSAQHPGITVLGPFDGRFSRRSETVTLRDQNNNPADTLRYFDGGRWPSKADAGGSTLELIDPDADNSLPAAWASSDELARTSWQTYTFRATAAASTTGPDSQWRDYILGMLEEGEVLLDDLTVTENPDGAAVAMISNGTFNNLNTWRPMGSHGEATIVPDPDGGGNVLHLKATGSTDHMHNHLETTLRNNETVVNGQEYEVSFRARWLSGNHLLNSRLYFNRIPHTFILERPDILGTPGAANSTLVANSGPTSENLSHSPVVPAVGETVTVNIDATDPDGVDNITLHYRVEGGSFTTAFMTQVGGSTAWQGNIPGQNAGNVVQFYLTATDTIGASSFIPAAGPDSRAMYEVEDGRAATTCINNFRIIMDPDDLISMETPRNLMSNGRIPCTVIDRENTAYYNTGVRLKGSHRARFAPLRVGFNVGFASDQLYRNVHRSVAIDRSEGQVVGQRELLFDLMATSSGGIPGEFNDLAYVISPNPIHTNPAILQMARLGSVFLEDQFEDGSDGTVYEYELVYYPTQTDAGGYKIPNGDLVVGRDINDMSNDPENYRWTYLVKNNQEFDDLGPAITLGKQFSKSTTEFNASIADVLDVDQWLRALAYTCATGANDSFYNNSNHNGQFYGRPDGKILYFPHDLDYSFVSNLGIFRNTELNRIIANQTYRRAYLAHLYDICTTTYNQSWMAPWTTHLDECVPGGNIFTDDLNYINTRSNFILGEISDEVSFANFAITTNNGNNFTTTSTPVTLAGRGWLNVDSIQLSNGTVLDHTWVTTDDWTLDLTLGQGTHPITLEAYDSQGNLLGSDSITITQNGGFQTPDMNNLVVSEIFYNPPGSDELTEFIELLNVGPIALDLSGTSFTDGIDFIFPEGTTLNPGEHILIVADQAAFTSAYGSNHDIAGVFANGTGLRNSGEMITLESNTGTVIQSFAYSDATPWPTEADGSGFSLVLINPESLPDHSLAQSWRPSALIGGNPSDSDLCPPFTGNALDDLDSDGFPALIEHFLGTSDSIPQNSHCPIQGSFVTEAGLTYLSLSVTYQVGKDDVQATAEVSTNLETWSSLPADVVVQSHTFNGDGTATIVWRSTKVANLDHEFIRLQVTAP